MKKTQLPDSRFTFVRNILHNYSNNLLPPDESKVHALLTDARSVQAFTAQYEKHPQPINFILSYFYLFLAQAEKDMISKKSIKREVYTPILYEQIKHYLQKQDEEDRLLGMVAFSLMKVDFNLPEYWDFSKDLSIDAFSKAFYGEIQLTGTKHLYLFSSLKNTNISQIQHVNSSGERLDMLCKIKLSLLYSTFTDIRKYKKVLDYVENNYTPTQDIESLAKYINPTRVLDYQLTLINTPELETRLYEYKMGESTQSFTLREIAKYNTMVKQLTQNIGLTHLPSDIYGLDSKRCATFSELCEHFYSDSFLQTKMLDFMREKAERAKKTNKSIWLNQVMSHSLSTGDEKKPIKRNKI